MVRQCCGDQRTRQATYYIFTKMATTSNDRLPSPMEKLRKFIKNNLLLLVTIGGVIVGLALGLALKPMDLSMDTVMLVSYPGEIFMRLLKLMILPLIIASLIAGCARLNASMNGKIAFRTLIYFFLTSLLNAILGTCLALLIHPGNPMSEHAVFSEDPAEDRGTHILDGVLDLGRNIFTDNLFKAAFQQAHTVYVPKHVRLINDTFNDTATQEPMEMVNSDVELVRDLRYREGTNTLGIIFFCLLFGTILGTMGSRAKVVVEFFTTVDEVVMRIVTGVMWLTPFGICSVICGKILSVGKLGLVLQQLGWFIFTVVLGVFIYQLIILQLIYFAIIRKNPYKYYWGLIQATVTAFATASTAASLPITFRCMDDKVRVDPRISRFILPIGCTINMDGTALFVAVSSFFIAQMNGTVLSVGESLTIMLASTAASFSSASVPSAALVLIFMVLSTVDVPSQDVTLLFAIDWFVDRVRTTNNMLGDCYAAAVVEHLSRDELKISDIDIGKNISNGHILPMTGASTIEDDLEGVVIDTPLKKYVQVD